MWTRSAVCVMATQCPRYASSSFGLRVAARLISSTQRRASGPRGTSGVSVEAHVQSLLRQPESRLPKFLIVWKTALQSRFTFDTVDPSYKQLLDRAAVQLYFDCANNFDYQRLIESFGLPDYLASWYRLTLMHTWMLQLRLHVSLDSDAYIRLQRGLLTSMWEDVDNRLDIMSKELGEKMTSKRQMIGMHGLHLQTYFEYDEGFLASDAHLAAAMWRCLYMEGECEPVNLRRVVTYIRSTIAYLDSLDVQEILVEGIREWKQLRPAAESSTLKTSTAVVESPSKERKEEKVSANTC